MPKRFTDTAIWSKEWFMELSPKLKCLIRYLFDNCDPSGVWNPNWKLASIQIGAEVCSDDLLKIPNNQFEFLPNGKVFIPDFINFQYGKLSEVSPAHKPIFAAIEKNRLSDRVFNRVLDRVSSTLQEKEKEQEKEKDKETTFGKSENLLAAIPANFTIEHCLEVALKDERWVGANKTNREELLQFNKFLEQLGSYNKNPGDYKKHFANLKNKWPDRVKPQAEVYSIDQLKEMSKSMSW